MGRPSSSTTEKGQKKTLAGDSTDATLSPDVTAGGQKYKRARMFGTLKQCDSITANY